MNMKMGQESNVGKRRRKEMKVQKNRCEGTFLT